MYIPRKIEKDILYAIEKFPVTAVTGPRQCGKSTMAKHFQDKFENFIYLDLERPSDLQKLDDAEWYFSAHRNSFFCIDEIQRKPELFPLIRSLVDEWGEAGKFLILGSASRDLLHQSTETLAGRIAYFRITPFLYDELDEEILIEKYIVRGAFPGSLLADSEKTAALWKENYILTFLERDLKLWSGANPAIMRRLWTMLAYNNGQTINYSAIGNSLGISSVSLKNYVDLLESFYMVEVLRPYHSNVGKRLVKTPKVYIGDSGITLELLNIENFDQLSGHSVLGSVWEQIVLSNLKASFRKAEFFFYRSSAGAEVDIVMHYKNKVFVIECKASLSPVFSKGFYYAVEDINPVHTFVVIPGSKGYSKSCDLDVVSIKELICKIDEVTTR